MFLVYDEAGNSPEFLCAVIEAQRSIVLVAFDPWQLFFRPVLAPAQRLALAVNQDAVRASLFDQRFLLSLVPRASFRACPPPLALGQSVRALEMYAPAKVPAISLRE